MRSQMVSVGIGFLLKEITTGINSFVERTVSINCCRFYSEFFGRNMPRDLICIRHYYKQICELFSLPKF